MTLLLFKSFFYCSFIFSELTTRSNSEKIQSVIFFLLLCLAKMSTSFSLMEPKKTKHLFYNMKACLSCSVWQTLFRLMCCLSELPCFVRASPPPSLLRLCPHQKRSEGAHSPYLTLRRVLLRGRKPVLSPACSCALPPCWWREMDCSRWPQSARHVLGPPAPMPPFLTLSHSGLSSRVLPAPQARDFRATFSSSLVQTPHVFSALLLLCCLVGWCRSLTACSFVTRSGKAK